METGARSWRLWPRCALRMGDLAGWASRTAGRGAGGTLPGNVVRRLLPDALAQLSAGRRTVLVSGTNGKSTTTTLLAEALRAGGDVVTNTDGANLLTGLVATLMTDRRGCATAVLEVDEVALPDALAATGAETVVLLNLSRDQLDRVGEVSSHAARWSVAMRRLPYLRIVANADDPLVVAAVRSARPDEVGVVWVGAGALWRADATLCPRCGFGWDTALTPWRCDRCDLAAPTPEWQLAAGAVVTPSGARNPLLLGLPGRAASVNALMAVAAASLLGVPVPAALSRMREVRQVDGRYLSAVVSGRKVQLLLAKNPAGWLELLEQLAGEQARLFLGINARAADGIDPSWLWDVPFERLRGKRVSVFGECGLDLSVRLHYAGVEHDLVTDLGTAIATAPDRELLVAANYTAFVEARSFVTSRAAA